MALLSLNDWERIVGTTYDNRWRTELTIALPGIGGIYVRGYLQNRRYDGQEIFNVGVEPVAEYRMRRTDVPGLEVWARDTLRGATLGRVLEERRDGRDYVNVQVDDYGTLFNFHIYLAD